jgi:hypothetical protein
MTKNMGTLDRVIRTIIALAIVGLYVSGRISGTLAVVLGIVAAIFLASSSIGVCPGYLVFGFSTCPVRKA